MFDASVEFSKAYEAMTRWTPESFENDIVAAVNRDFVSFKGFALIRAALSQAPLESFVFVFSCLSFWSSEPKEMTACLVCWASWS